MTSVEIQKKTFHSSNSDYSYDLMISCSHQANDICHQIYEKLLAVGLKKPMVSELIEWQMQLKIVNLFLFVYHIDMKQVHSVKQKDNIHINYNDRLY